MALLARRNLFHDRIRFTVTLTGIVFALVLIVVGAIVGWFYDRRADRTPKPEATKQLGVLLASGLIVGEGIIGVVISAIVVFSGKDFPLSVVGSSYETAGIVVGGAAFVILLPTVSAFVA